MTAVADAYLLLFYALLKFLLLIPLTFEKASLSYQHQILTFHKAVVFHQKLYRLLDLQSAAIPLVLHYHSGDICHL